MSTAERIRLTRAAFYQRTAAPRTASAYPLYVLAIGVIAVVIPAINLVETAVATPEITRALASRQAPMMAGLIGAGILTLATACGPLRGPVQLPPFLVMSLAGADLPRRRIFARPFALAAAVVAAVVTGVAVIAGVCLASTGSAQVSSVVAWAVSGAGFAVLAATCWLAGQRLAGRAWILAAALAVLAVATAFGPVPVVPWQWLAATWPTAPAQWAVAALCLAAIAAACLAPALLAGIRAPDLLTQASRWNLAQACAWSGSLSTAVAAFRPAPAIGRSWPAASGRTQITRYLIRDTVTLLRLPVRTISGTLAIAAAGALLATAPQAATAGLSALAAASAGLLGYTAAGTLADAFAHVSENVAGPALYREGIGHLFALHAMVPLLWVSAALSAGAILATGGITLGQLATVVVVAILLVALRMFQSVKGMLPLALLTPMPTPMGPDFSPAVVLAWQLDAPLIAGLGAVIVGQTSAWNAAAGLGVIGVVALLTARRVAKLRG